VIRILAEETSEPAAQAIAAALQQQYNLARAPELVPSGAVWESSVEWDDLLFVIYQSKVLPDPAVNYIQTYRDAHKSREAIIPVSTNPDFKRPPEPLSGLKAAEYDGTPATLDRIVKVAGVFLGQALRPGSQRIFVSYRQTDGAALAQEIYKRLEAASFQPWLDVAKENIAIGADVQNDIQRGIDTAALILLVDTPDAPASPWVSIEVDLANAQLLPVLPIVAGGERTSRFIQLQSLRRQALVKQNGLDAAPLSDAEWEGVRREIEELLLSTFRRRLKILSRAQATFQANGYNWQALDERLRMYLADKEIDLVGKMIVLSHCLVQDVTYLPALVAYWNHVEKNRDLANINQKLCIYDRDNVLSQAEMKTLRNNLPGVNAIFAHYNELEILVSTTFTRLR
jgi:hypothetical protein